MAAIRYDDRVFPVGIKAMRRCLLELRPDTTVHGFRATFRTWAAYQRDAAKRRVLMADWADFCASDRIWTT